MKKLNIDISEARYFYDILSIILANSFKNKIGEANIKHKVSEDFKECLESLFNLDSVGTFEINGKKYSKDNVEDLEKALNKLGIKECFSINPDFSKTMALMEKIAFSK